MLCLLLPVPTAVSATPRTTDARVAGHPRLDPPGVSIDSQARLHGATNHHGVFKSQTHPPSVRKRAFIRAQKRAIRNGGTMSLCTKGDGLVMNQLGVQHRPPPHTSSKPKHTAPNSISTICHGMPVASQHREIQSCRHGWTVKRDNALTSLQYRRRIGEALWSIRVVVFLQCTAEQAKLELDCSP